VSWVTKVSAGGTPRSKPSQVGCEITVGATPIQVTSLGRLVVPGDMNAHNLSIVSAAGAMSNIFQSFSRTVYLKVCGFNCVQHSRGNGRKHFAGPWRRRAGPS
jgi:hypothetical protein